MTKGLSKFMFIVRIPLFLLTLLNTISCGEANVNSITLPHDGEGEVSSPGFPTRCCQEIFTFTLQTVPGDTPAFIRISFSDLDLPPGSALKIYDGDRASSDKLFPDQPEYLRGAWKRPFLSASVSGGAILVVLDPAEKDIDDDTVYTGFRLEYYVTNAPPDNWLRKPVRGVCPPIASPVDGDVLRISSMDFGDYHGTTIDCVWQLKIPNLSSEIRKRKLLAYVRIISPYFKGYMDVLEGISSIGKVILAIDTTTPGYRYSEVEPNQGFSSRKGLYLHLTLLNEGHGTFEFVYGLFHQQQDLIQIDGEHRSCSFGKLGGGFVCHIDNTFWCIPAINKCNGAINCIGGSDEDIETTCDPRRSTTLVAPTTTLATTTKAPVSPIHIPTMGCRGARQMCKDWTCRQLYTCPAAVGGSVCNSYSVKWCPGQGCIGRTSRGLCNQYCKECPDGTCSYSNSCPGECPRKKCSDGTCIDYNSECPSDCDVREKYCKNHQIKHKCILDTYLCDYEDCPTDGHQKCDNARQCYASYEKCDGYPDCHDSSDEKDCAMPASEINRHAASSTMYIVILVPIIVILLIVIIASIVIAYFCCKRRNQGNPAVTTYTTVALQEPNTDATHFTGTRMQPVPASAPTVGPAQEPSAPPPPYHMVVDGPEQRPLQMEQVPPPSYNSLA